MHMKMRGVGKGLGGERQVHPFRWTWPLMMVPLTKGLKNVEVALSTAIYRGLLFLGGSWCSLGVMLFLLKVNQFSVVCSQLAGWVSKSCTWN